MCGWIRIGFTRVAGTAYHFTIGPEHYRADGHVVGRQGCLGFRQREAHRWNVHVTQT